MAEYKVAPLGPLSGFNVDVKAKPGDPSTCEVTITTTAHYIACEACLARGICSYSYNPNNHMLQCMLFRQRELALLEENHAREQ